MITPGLEWAAETLRRCVQNATPGPWRDSVVDGNRYAALVSDTVHPRRAYGQGWEWDEGYGGCLVGESHMSGDRRLMAVMRNVVDELPDLLEAIAHEDPIAAGRAARRVAEAVISTHRPSTREV